MWPYFAPCPDFILPPPPPSFYTPGERCLSGEVLVFVCVGGSSSLKWLFSIISRVSSGVSVRVPSGLYTESSFAFLSLQFFRILLILADSLADSVSAQNLRLRYA